MKKKQEKTVTIILKMDIKDDTLGYEVDFAIGDVLENCPVVESLVEVKMPYGEKEYKTELRIKISERTYLPYNPKGNHIYYVTTE